MVQTALLNREVITVNQHNEVFEACLVEGNKIIALGTSDEIVQQMAPSATVIDLEGKSVFPGLIDAHMHLYLFGDTLIHLDCKEPVIHSVDELLQKLSEIVKETESGKVIRVFGFNELKVKEKRYPTIQELDRLTTEHPIMITRTCGHIGMVNSATLDLLRIDEETPDPLGGTIEKDRSKCFHRL